MKTVSYKLILVAVGVWMLNASATLEDAQRLYEQGRNSEAMDEVNNLLASNPKDAEVRFMQGIIFAENGSSDRAIEVFAGLTQDFPELPEPWNNLAVLFAEKGEFNKARESLLAAIQTHPSYSTAHENLGDLYARMAGMAYDQALEKDRGNESARLKLSAVNGLFAAPSWNTDEPIVVAANNPAPTTPAASTTSASQPAIREPAPAQITAPPPVVKNTPDPIVKEPEPVKVAVADPVPVVAADISKEVETTVRRWAAAWSSKNVEQYLDSYSANYRPANGASHQSWARYRRERITTPTIIEVELSDLVVNRLDGNTATATFGQRYRSDNYRDEVTKVLTFSKIDGAWRIISEVSE